MCAECRRLREQAEIAFEDVERLKEQIADAFGAGAVSRELLEALERRERAHERRLAEIERHAQSHLGARGESLGVGTSAGA